MLGGFFALVFAALYNEVHSLIPKLIYKFYLISSMQMHRSKTRAISLNSPALLCGTS